MFKCDGKEVLTLSDLHDFTRAVQAEVRRVLYQGPDNVPMYPQIVKVAAYEELPEVSDKEVDFSEMTCRVYEIEAKKIVHHGGRYLSYQYEGIELYRCSVGGWRW